jgi:hypothetical protein
MKQSLGHGATAAMVDRVDPIPDAVYSALAKVGEMVSSDESVARFLSYPGVKPLAEHPKIVALQSDPQVSREVLERDYRGSAAKRADCLSGQRSGGRCAVATVRVSKGA